MIRTKVFKLLFCLVMMQSVPAHAVTEPAKVAQDSIRMVQDIMETVKTVADLIISVNMTSLQGLIGSIKPQVPDPRVEMELFAPTVTSEVQALLSSDNVVPDVSSYVEKELKARDPSDEIAERDALIEINERLAISSMEAIAYGKETAALQNGAVEDNENLLDSAAGTSNQQEAHVQEAAIGVKIMENDALINQLQARDLETFAQGAIANVRSSTVNKEATEGRND